MTEPHLLLLHTGSRLRGKMHAQTYCCYTPCLSTVRLANCLDSRHATSLEELFIPPTLPLYHTTCCFYHRMNLGESQLCVACMANLYGAVAPGDSSLTSLFLPDRLKEMNSADLEDFIVQCEQRASRPGPCDPTTAEKPAGFTMGYTGTPADEMWDELMYLHRATIFQKLQLTLERGGILGEDHPQSHACLAHVARVFFQHRAGQGVSTWPRCQDWLCGHIAEDTASRKAYADFERLIQRAHTECTQELPSWTQLRTDLAAHDEAVFESVLEIRHDGQGTDSELQRAIIASHEDEVGEDELQRALRVSLLDQCRA